MRTARTPKKFLLLRYVALLSRMKSWFVRGKFSFQRQAGGTLQLTGNKSLDRRPEHRLHLTKLWGLTRSGRWSHQEMCHHRRSLGKNKPSFACFDPGTSKQPCIKPKRLSRSFCLIAKYKRCVYLILTPVFNPQKWSLLVNEPWSEFSAEWKSWAVLRGPLTADHSSLWQQATDSTGRVVRGHFAFDAPHRSSHLHLKVLKCKHLVKFAQAFHPILS